MAEYLLIFCSQPFVVEASPSIAALKNMVTALDGELSSLLAYYGEDPDSPEPSKLEEFFKLVLDFSSALQVSYIALVGVHT